MKRLKEALLALGLGGLAITASLVFCPEDSENVMLRGQKFTKAEYAQMKAEMVSKHKNETMNLMERRIWIAMVNKELKKKGGMKNHSVKGDVLDGINLFLEGK